MGYCAIIRNSILITNEKMDDLQRDQPHAEGKPWYQSPDGRTWPKNPFERDIDDGTESTLP